MHVVRLKNSEWNRGGRYGATFLLNGAGAMCCLGVYGRSMGADDAVLLEQGMPSDACDDHPEAIGAFSSLVLKGETFFYNPDPVWKMANINDAGDLSDEERVALLNEQANPLGIHFEFAADE